jgi:hypothetical protein
MKILIALLFSLCLPALADDSWPVEDKALLVASTAFLIADWGQTRTIAKKPHLVHEKNPILGRHPSVGRVNT